MDVFVTVMVTLCPLAMVPPCAGETETPPSKGTLADQPVGAGPRLRSTIATDLVFVLQPRLTRAGARVSQFATGVGVGIGVTVAVAVGTTCAGALGAE